MRTFPELWIVGFLIGSGVLISLVAVIGGLMHARSNRLLAHTERMKALEMGRELPTVATRTDPISGDGAEQSPAGKCYSIAGKACFWGFLFAMGAASRDFGNTPGVAYAIAASAGAIGVTSIICGTIIAARSPRESSAGAHAKPHYESSEV